MGLKPYIGDGQERTFYLAGIPNLSPPVRFTARRMAAFKSSALFKQASLITDPEKDVALYMAAVAQRIRSITYLDTDSGEWKPIDDENGKPLVAASDATLKGLEPKLWWRIRDIVMGGEAADVDPDTDQSQPPEAENEKNSETGSGSS
jgi:hypothetical protein